MNILAQPATPAKGRPLGDVLAFPTTRAADRVEMARFLNTAFRHCLRELGWIALKAFGHQDGRPVAAEWGALSTGREFVTAAVRMATEVANREGAKRAVFAPPVAIFGDQKNESGQRFAGESNVVCAPVVVVELDERPSASLDTLRSTIGEPTIIVQSGGLWQGEPKLHAYWRLREPARSPEAMALLKKTRLMAARLVGGDGTAVALSHPLRWPGSWHTKAEPRLCRVIGGDRERDVDLEDVAAKLDAAVRAAGLDVAAQAIGGIREGFKTAEPWPAEDLAEAAKIIPNEGRNWDRWSTIGMTFFDTSHGSPDGLEAFHAWGEKADAYDADATDERWAHWHRSPPMHLHEGTLLRELRKVSPGYMPSHQTAQRFEVPSVLPAAAASAGPVDIFAHDDQAELGVAPAGSLPEVLAAWVRTEAPRKGVPEAFAAIAAVVTAAAAIGNSLRIQVQQRDPSWQEPASLFAVIVADPGSNKSGILAEAAEPLRCLDREYVRDWQARRKLWEQADRTYRKASRRAAADAPHPGDEPICRRASVDNFTTEKLVRILADNPRGVICRPDEFSGLLGALGAYKKGSADDRALLLRLADGRDVQIDRVGAGTVTADNALVSILASTQPDVLQSATRDLGSDGLMQRFLFVLHDGVPRRGLDQEPDHAALAAYATTIRGLAQDEHPPVHVPIKLTPEAGRLMNEGRDALDRLKGLASAGTAFRGHVEKWGKFLPRLVLVFHAIEEFERVGHVDRSRMIEVRTVETAVRFAHFLMRHSLRFYETFVAADEATSGARVVADFLLANPERKEVRPRDLVMARRAFQGADGSRALHEACQQLEAAGWLEATELRSNGQAAGWRVQPEIHVRFAAHAERAKRENARRREGISVASRQRAAINGQIVEHEQADVSAASVFD